MVSLAVYLKLIGFSFLQAKLFRFLCFLAAGLLLSTITPGRSNKLWVLALWFYCPFVLMASTTIRMEAIGILITCLTIYALKKEASAVVLGILAGSTILTHPMYLACGAAIGVVILFRKDWRQFLLFSLAVFVVISLIYGISARTLPFFRSNWGFSSAGKPVDRCWLSSRLI
jgi:hypothetical protein